jgi:hypothetical protein
MQRERTYSACNWLALALGLLAAILGAIALGTPWYRVEDSSRYTTTYYRWEGGVHTSLSQLQSQLINFNIQQTNRYCLLPIRVCSGDGRCWREEEHRILCVGSGPPRQPHSGAHRTSPASHLGPLYCCVSQVGAW